MASTSCQRSGVMVLLYLSQAPQKSEQGRLVRGIQREPKRMSGNRPSGDAGAFPPAGNVMRFQPINPRRSFRQLREALLCHRAVRPALEQLLQDIARLDQIACKYVRA